ncbi:MAG: 30S ribosomal protein S7 [Puniceicoccales bacterium]|jgi:small subunit ribosomal protein S7|nr:30S ribosomal protein S7 [Puniceicoccales bacterium]
MARRRRAVRRKLKEDPRYKSTLVEQLTNRVMRSGKKSLARRIVYGAIERVSENLGKGDPMDFLLAALENVRPKLEVKSRRVGGATYQVPVEVGYERQVSLAFRWLVQAANKRKGAMVETLASEIIEAYNSSGEVVKKKEEVHRMAQANRAFAHLRWS